MPPAHLGTRLLTGLSAAASLALGPPGCQKSQHGCTCGGEASRAFLCLDRSPCWRKRWPALRCPKLRRRVQICVGLFVELLDHMAGAGALTVADAPVESAASQPEQAVRAEAEPLAEERGLMAALGSS